MDLKRDFIFGAIQVCDAVGLHKDAVVGDVRGRIFVIWMLLCDDFSGEGGIAFESFAGCDGGGHVDFGCGGVGCLSPVALAVVQVAGLVVVPEGMTDGQDERQFGKPEVPLAWRHGDGSEPFDVGQDAGTLPETLKLLCGAAAIDNGIVFDCLVTAVCFCYFVGKRFVCFPRAGRSVDGTEPVERAGDAIRFGGGQPAEIKFEPLGEFAVGGTVNGGNGGVIIAVVNAEQVFVYRIGVAVENVTDGIGKKGTLVCRRQLVHGEGVELPPHLCRQLTAASAGTAVGMKIEGVKLNG